MGTEEIAFEIRLANPDEMRTLIGVFIRLFRQFVVLN